MGTNIITYGGWTFADDAVKSAALHLASGVVSTLLEADTLTAVVKSEDPSITRFRENTPLVFRHRETSMRVLGDSRLRLVVDKKGRAYMLPRFKGGSRRDRLFQGRFYLRDVERVGLEHYRLSAISSIGLLMDRAHPGGVYTGQSAESVIKDICGDVPVIVKSGMKYVPLYGWLPYCKPPDSSARDNLCQVLFALGAAVRADADGVLRVFYLWPGLSGAAPAERIYSGAGVEYGSLVSSVSVSEHQYLPGGGEEKLYEGVSLQGDTIYFQEPVHDIQAVGFSILDSGANYAVLSQGDGILTGRKYQHIIREISRPVTPGAAENVVNVQDATLVSLTNSRSAAERLAGYYKYTETIRCGVVTKQQAAGDVIRAYNPYDKITVSGCVESMDVNASNILRADMNVLSGYSPPDMGSMKYVERRIFVPYQDSAPNVTVNIPETVLTVRAVLIGGGGWGAYGMPGKAGGKGGDVAFSSTKGDAIGENGAPGEGGEGGRGGAGGKVLIVDIENPPRALSIIPGVGGRAQTRPNMNDAKEPAESYIISNGVYFSSKNGAHLANGYTDPITGEVYALPGTDGQDGGSGGGAGGVKIIVGGGIFDDAVQAIPGERGEDMPPAAGGAPNEDFRLVRGYTKNDSTMGTRSIVRVFQLPAGGGGAASGKDGRNAGTVIQDEGEDSGTATPGQTPNPFLWGTGGAGADALPPEPVTTPGSGGNGGNGGGGGGAGGSAYIGVRAPGEWGGTHIEDSLDGMPGGKGGKGSKGTDGAGGCVILYYTEGISIQHGALMDSRKRFVLDRFGRLIVI